MSTFNISERNDIGTYFAVSFQATGPSWDAPKTIALDCFLPESDIANSAITDADAHCGEYGLTRISDVIVKRQTTDAL